MLINPCFELWEIILAVRAFQICILDDGESGTAAPVNPRAIMLRLFGCLADAFGGVEHLHGLSDIWQAFKSQNCQGDRTDAVQDLATCGSLHAEASLSRNCLASNS
ncbi:hypothetical protein ALQ45_200040 [Pseudomonas amygdali pv. morsprunorum]|nr:hypothetical protein ALQ45_200040 [Pseudomonas amygdali pv. morsprunorum]